MKNNFEDLISMIKNDKEGKLFGVKTFMGKKYYGEIKKGLIENGKELKIVDNENLCQDLYDALKENFEDIQSGYTHDLIGKYEYFMIINDNSFVMFPQGYEYQKWIYNQIQIDRDNRKLQK